MKNLNNKQILILNTLLKNDEPISAQQVGRTLELSARTVRYNLDQIRHWLNDNNLELITKPNVGLFIPVSEVRKNDLINKINNSCYSYVSLSKEYRKLWIEFDLLNKGTPYKAFNFQHELGISHNTCSKDIHLIEEGLKEWGLRIARTPGLGTEIRGPEIQYRYRLISIIRSVLDENDLITLCLWNKINIENDHSELNFLKVKILNDIKKWNLTEAWRAVKKLDSKFLFNFSDTDLVRHTLYIASMCKRIASKNIIEISQEKLDEIKKHQIFDEIKSITSLFELNKYHTIPKEEIGQLSLEVSAGKVLGALEFSLEEIKPMSTWIFDYVGKELGCDLQNPMVIKMLSQHLLLSITRLRHDLPVTNPILDDIEEKYSSTLISVKKAVSQHPQLNKINFPVSELGYIALYVEMAKIEAGINTERRKKVIVVCPTGGITVGMLILRIKKELAMLDVVDVLSIRAFNRKVFNFEIDAVITTSPSLTHKDFKIICVNPLLEKKDINSIIHQLNLDEINE